jgi:hypothetical protein
MRQALPGEDLLRRQVQKQNVRGLLPLPHNGVIDHFQFAPGGWINPSATLTATL